MEALRSALAIEGLEFLLFGVLLAGLVRGFSGFGTALVFLPFAAQVLPPVWALVSLTVMDMFGPLPNVRRAIRDGHPRNVGRLALGALFGLPFGISLLTRMEPELFRSIVSILALGLLALLILGVRYNGPFPRPLLFGTGGLGGFLAGAVGLPGPPVIMLYMASPEPPSVIRANILLYLLLTDIMMLAMFGVSGLLSVAPVVLGLVFTLPYVAANMVGAALFRPERVAIYRVLAYVIIAGSAINGLPIFD